MDQKIDVGDGKLPRHAQPKAFRSAQILRHLPTVFPINTAKESSDMAHGIQPSVAATKTLAGFIPQNIKIDGIELELVERIYASNRGGIGYAGASELATGVDT